MVAEALLVADIRSDTADRNWWQYHRYVDRTW